MKKNTAAQVQEDRLLAQEVRRELRSRSQNVLVRGRKKALPYRIATEHLSTRTRHAFRLSNIPGTQKSGNTIQTSKRQIRQHLINKPQNTHTHTHKTHRDTHIDTQTDVKVNNVFLSFSPELLPILVAFWNIIPPTSRSRVQLLQEEQLFFFAVDKMASLTNWKQSFQI